MDLSKDEIFNLIDEYKKHRVLWDTSYKGHFNKNTKIMAWEEIAETCGIDARDARRKMASLLGSFRREKAKLKITKANSENVIVIISFICLQYYVYLLNEVIYSLMFDYFTVTVHPPDQMMCDPLRFPPPSPPIPHQWNREIHF